jgi:DhnA family fructose-bisphosphate aldolase class Ia
MHAITNGTDRLFLFAVDQKIEHLNKDFFGPNIHPDAAHPENIFIKARDGNVGALATNFGLISRYAKKYKQINYIVKLNGKTNLLKAELDDPCSTQLWYARDAAMLACRGLPVRGIGYTLYLGSTHEHIMLQQAAQAIIEAHKHGLVAILWVYPRGKSVENPKHGDIIAGAAGIANALGADFVKINPPEQTSEKTSAQLLAIAAQAAGNTKTICAGGAVVEVNELLRTVHDQLTIGTTNGIAIGRNLITRSIADAVALSHALRALVYKNQSIEGAQAIYQTMLTHKSR